MDVADVDSTVIHGARRTTGKTRADDRGPASPVASWDLIASGTIDRPVDVARVLKRYGLSLRDAHAVLDAVVAGAPVQVSLRGAQDAIVENLLALGAQATLHRR